MINETPFGVSFISFFCYNEVLNSVGKKMNPDQKNSFEYYKMNDNELKKHDPVAHSYNDFILAVLELDKNVFYVDNFSDFEFYIGEIYNNSFSMRLSCFGDNVINVYISDSISSDDEFELFKMRDELFVTLESKIFHILKNKTLLDTIKRSVIVEADMNGLFKKDARKNHESFLANKDEEPTFENPSEIYSKYTLNYSLSLTYKELNDFEPFDVYNKSYLLKKHGILINHEDYLFLKRALNSASLDLYKCLSRIVLQLDHVESKEASMINSVLEFDENGRLTKNSKELLSINFKV